MKTLKFEIEINAPREKVWDAIVNVEKYKRWCDEFHEGSYFEGGWNEGDSIRFLCDDEEGNKSGMLSEIAKSTHPEYISIKHIGQIVKGKEDRDSDEVKKWVPAYENYTLEKLDDGKTKFSVSMDAPDEYAGMFDDMWKRALVKLKSVSEV